MSAEHRAHISAGLTGVRKGKSNSWFVGDKNPMRNPAVVAKVSAAQKGRPKSAEHKAKISAALAGRKMPEAQRLRMLKPDAEVGYINAHDRLRAKRGLASKYRCRRCKGPASQWALRHGRGDRTEGTLRFSLDPADYIPLCGKCHAAYDKAGRRKSST